MTSVFITEQMISIMQSTANRLQIAQPVNFNDNDMNTILLRRMINRTVEELADDFPWPQLNKEMTFTLVTGQDAYPLPGDFDSLVNDTLWNRTQRWPLIGPLDPVLWQQYKSGLVTTLPRQRFRVKGWKTNQFYIDPTPTSAENGQIITLEYQSGTYYKPPTWVASTSWLGLQYCSLNGNIYDRGSSGAATTGTTPPTWTTGTNSDGLINWTYVTGAYNRFASNQDTPLLSPSAIENGATWRFLQARGLDYEALRADAEEQLEVEKTKLQGAEIISINRKQIGPVGIGPWSYPEGNFNI